MNFGHDHNPPFAKVLLDKTCNGELHAYQHRLFEPYLHSLGEHEFSGKTDHCPAYALVKHCRKNTAMNHVAPATKPLFHDQG